MSDARMACLFVQAVAQRCFPDNAVQMEGPCVHWLVSIADVVDSGSHKYIPAARLSADLGCAEGAGVYGYIKFRDGSYLLKTCHHGVAVWEGGDERAFVPDRKA